MAQKEDGIIKLVELGLAVCVVVLFPYQMPCGWKSDGSIVEQQ